MRGPAPTATAGAAPALADPVTSHPRDTFDRSTIVALGAAHLAHDSYPAFVGVLLPVLIGRLGISLAAAGLLASSIRWSSVVGNPILGYLGDRRDTRYWIAIAPMATAICMSLVGLAPSFEVALFLLLATGVSHSAFHPSAGAMATRAAGRRWGRGTSYFMTGGEVGRSIGPVFIAATISLLGVGLSWLAALPGILASGILVVRLRRAAAVAVSRTPGDLRGALRSGWRWIAVLSTAMLFRSTANIGFIVFYPTLATSLGASLLVAGLGVAVYELGGVCGTFLGGTLSDRIGRRAVLAGGVTLGMPSLALALLTGFGPLHLALLACAGLGVVSANSVQLVVMQELFPENRGVGAGVNFLVGGLGAIIATVAVGVIAAAIGLRATLLLAAGIGALSLPLFLALPETRSVSLWAPAAD